MMMVPGKWRLMSLGLWKRSPFLPHLPSTFLFWKTYIIFFWAAICAHCHPSHSINFTHFVSWLYFRVRWNIAQSASKSLQPLPVKWIKFPNQMQIGPWQSIEKLRLLFEINNSLKYSVYAALCSKQHLRAGLKLWVWTTSCRYEPVPQLFWHACYVGIW